MNRRALNKDAAKIVSLEVMLPSLMNDEGFCAWIGTDTVSDFVVRAWIFHKICDDKPLTFAEKAYIHHMILPNNIYPSEPAHRKKGSLSYEAKFRNDKIFSRFNELRTTNNHETAVEILKKEFIVSKGTVGRAVTAGNKIKNSQE